METNKQTAAARIRLSESVQSAIEVEVLDPIHEADHCPAIRAAYVGGSLLVTSETAAALWREIVDLNNALDDIAEGAGTVSDDERKFSARVVRSLTTLSAKVWGMVPTEAKRAA